MDVQATTRPVADVEGRGNTMLTGITATRYQMLAELGRGGMATAYLAAILGPGGFSKLVVVKRLHPAHADDPDFLRMFLEEARLAGRIDHPNVVHTTEVGSDGDNYFIAMEYIEGQSLELITRRAQSLKSDGDAFPLRLHLAVLAQVLAGLHFAHELADFDGRPLNLVHRDVSPHNVMVTYDGNVKLVDFGIAKAASTIGDTSTGVVKGKAHYMPSEQFDGRPVDRRSDLFAVGVMLWQALAKRRLWTGLGDTEIYRRLMAGDLPTPRSVNPEVPPALDAICMRALAAKKEDRYESAADFQSAIEAFVTANPAYHATPREIGATMVQLFEEARAKLRAIIEERLCSSSPPSGEVPVISSSRIAVPGMSITPVAMNCATPPPPSPALPQSGGPRHIAAMSLAAALVLSLAGGAAHFASASARARGADVRTERAPARRSRLTVVARPADAKIFFDDVALDGNPAVAWFDLDSASHRVRAEAPGFVSRAESVVVDSSIVSVSLDLVRSGGDEGDTLDGHDRVAAPATRAGASPRAMPRTPLRRSPAGAALHAGPPAVAQESSLANADTASTAEAPAQAVAPIPGAMTAPPRGRLVRIDKNNPFSPSP